jgi:hypothetical protein
MTPTHCSRLPLKPHASWRGMRAGRASKDGGACSCPCGRRGMALPVTLTLLLGLAILGMAIVSLSVTSSRLADRGFQKTQATALAEAGVHAFYTKIAIGMANASNPTYPASVSSATLSSTIGGVSTTDGTYSARLVNTPAASTSGTATTYTFVVEGAGTAPNGVTQSKVRSVFTVSRGAYGSYPFVNSALESNGTITLSGGAKTSDPSGHHLASASANGVVDVSGGSSVDGVIAVAASAYSTTLSKCPGQTVQQLSSPLTFPSASTLSTWASSWTGQAKEATSSFPSGQILSSFSAGSTAVTLTAPCYISGGLTLSGGASLTVQPDTSAAAPYILYVHGKIVASGGSSITNKGVLIISDSTITASGGSCVAGYSVTDLTNSGLISLSTSSNGAITLSGGTAANSIGFCYAAEGGATLSGGSQITGSLIAGGTSCSVTFSGGSSLVYPDGLNSFKGFPSMGYTAGALSQWNQIL